jgi:hypothetical protein
MIVFKKQRNISIRFASIDIQLIALNALRRDQQGVVDHSILFFCQQTR